MQIGINNFVIDEIFVWWNQEWVNKILVLIIIGFVRYYDLFSLLFDVNHHTGVIFFRLINWKTPVLLLFTKFQHTIRLEEVTQETEHFHMENIHTKKLFKIYNRRLFVAFSPYLLRLV